MSFIIMGISLLLGLVGLLYLMLIRQLRPLSHQLTEINATHSLSKRIVISGKGQVNAIASSINQLLDNVQTAQEKQEEQISKRLSELDNVNQALKNKIANLKPIASRAIEPINQRTKLLNRTYFNEILNKSIKHADRHENIMAILLIDIHPEVSDETIINEISLRLEKSLRSEDILAKLDNDEFIILLNKIDKPEFASIVSEKLLKSFSKPIHHENNELMLSANIGICTFPDDGKEIEILLKNVDTALNKAKSFGENNYYFYNPETNLLAHDYILMETALKNAIKHNELALYYQPKINIKKGSTTGLEALLRWINPNFGIVYPLQFLNMADETGFFLPLAEWVIREACKTNKHWQDEGYAHIAVGINLTKKQFHHPGLVKIIDQALKDFNLNPKYLEIEIDENSVMEDVDASYNAIFAIKETGVRISIDHFGKGYTSISYLKKFPISAIKIDSSFIAGIPNNPNDSAITSSFIALAHKLGIEVIATGVETAEQVLFLSEQRCDLMQGYFLNTPLPAEKIQSQLPKLSEEVLI